VLGNLLFCFGGVRVGQSFVVLVGIVLGNLLFCFGGVRVGKSFVLFLVGFVLFDL
jgi:hypothetical protein